MLEYKRRVEFSGAQTWAEAGGGCGRDSRDYVDNRKVERWS